MIRANVTVTRAGLLMIIALCLLTPLHAQDAAATFKAKCSVCHAADGSSNSAMGKQLGAKDLRSAEVQKQTDPQLNATITNGMGGGKMPDYKGKLTDVQIKDLVTYVRSLAKKP